MGVIVLDDVVSGELFGPIPPSLTIADPILLIGHMTADNTPDLHTVKIDINKLAGLRSLSEWIPYVRAARDVTEQNMAAVLLDSHLYYRSTKPITAGNELFVWYNDDLAKIVGVPEIETAYIKDNKKYTCPYCSKQFMFPYSLRAHMRFKCEKSPYQNVHDNGVRKTFTSTYSPENTNKPPRQGFFQNNISPETSGTTSSGSEPSPETSSNQNKRALKRKLTISQTDEALNLVKYENKEREFTQIKDTPIDIEETVTDDELSVHEEEDINVCSENDTLSAFHKVVKHEAPLAPKDTPAILPPFVNPYIRPLISGMIPHLNATRHMRPQGMPRPLHDIPMHLRQASKENIPETVHKVSGLALKNREDLRNLVNSGKLPFHPDWRFQFPYIRCQNPIVEHLLLSASTSAPTPPVSLPVHVAQNWCVKCNATFRMTSDLVYHMRSHHKEEVEKVKPKPMEKLRCDICGDRFKERHHLTRHMTSHQEL